MLKRSTAIAIKDEYDEVPMSSMEVLEANVVTIRDALIEFKSEVHTAFAKVNDEIKSLREKSDKNFERLSTKIDATNARIDVTNQEVGQLSKTVIRTESRLNALVWLWGGLGGLGGLITLVTALDRIFHWFQ
ncbi:MAG: hypothetical protein WDO56_18890 [Gammaproteobacteria bacterium]